MTRWLATRLLPLVLTPLLAQAQGVALQTVTGSELGIELYGQAYDADRDGTSELAMESRKLGVTGSFTQALADGWYWGGDGRYAWGATTYTSATRGRNSANPETLAEVRVIGGRDIALGTQILSTYAGLGYRSVDSRLKGYTDTGYVSPSRIGNLVYLPIGVTHRLRLDHGARLSTTLEGDYVLDGTQTTRYTDIAGYVSDLNVSQRRGYGARLGLAYETEFWSTGLFFHYWNIQESEPGTYASGTTVYSATEAHNVTREVGIQLKYRFR